MNKPLPIRASSLSSILIASFTVLALLVAPICAPLCAARTCASNTGQDRCHDMAEMNSGGGNQIDTVHKLCGAVDLSAILVKLDDHSFSSRFLSADSVLTVLDASSSQHSPNSGPIQIAAGCPTFPNISGESRLLGILLRI